MIVYDESTGFYYDSATGRRVEAPPVEVDHSQNPLIGVALLLFVLWIAYQMTSAYYGGVVITWVP